MTRPTVFRIAAGFALLLALSIALRPLLPVDETRYLDVAWEMRLTGDVLHLTRNFGPYSHKPPLLFWLINLVWLAAPSDYLARAVAPAGAVLALPATAALARRFWPRDEGAPVRAAGVLAGFVAFAIYGSATMFDSLLTLATLGGIAALWRIGTGQGGRAAWTGLGLALTLGLYAKGPVIFVHLLPPLVLIRVWAPAPPPVRTLAGGAAAAILLAAGLFALWLGPALASADAAYRHDLLWTQSVARVAGGMAHDRPFWFFLALLPVLIFPWGWSWRLWRGVPRVWAGDGPVRLAVVWAAAPLVLFSLMASKQAHYLLPELPALALIFGRLLGPRAAPVRSLAPWAALAAALAVALGSAAWPAPWPVPLTRPALLLFAPALAGLALVSLRLPVLPGHLTLGWGLVAALHVLIAASGLARQYDPRPLAEALAEGQGLAVTGMDYNAEVNFAARLTAPVATPAGTAALSAWAAANPRGLIFGPVDSAPIACPPAREIAFGGRTFGIWPASAIAVSVPESAPAG